MGWGRREIRFKEPAPGPAELEVLSAGGDSRPETREGLQFESGLACSLRGGSVGREKRRGPKAGGSPCVPVDLLSTLPGKGDLRGQHHPGTRPPASGGQRGHRQRRVQEERSHCVYCPPPCVSLCPPPCGLTTPAGFWEHCRLPTQGAVTASRCLQSWIIPHFLPAV